MKGFTERLPLQRARETFLPKHPLESSRHYSVLTLMNGVATRVHVATPKGSFHGVQKFLYEWLRPSYTVTVSISQVRTLSDGEIEGSAYITAPLAGGGAVTQILAWEFQPEDLISVLCCLPKKTLQ